MPRDDALRHRLHRLEGGDYAERLMLRVAEPIAPLVRSIPRQKGASPMDWDDIDQGFLPAVVYGHPDEHIVASDGSVIDTVKPEGEDRPEGAVDCDGCRGDGIYYGRGSVVNGVFVGFTGTCFRCHGKGFQTEADSKRCRYYDNHVRRFTL